LSACGRYTAASLATASYGRIDRQVLAERLTGWLDGLSAGQLELSSAALDRIMGKAEQGADMPDDRSLK